ncbi:MAG: AtpZ/AtpI family protein [Armatimonadota bacterium]
MSDEPIKPEMPSDAEIEARFSKIKENLTTDLDDADEKLAAILDKTHAPKIETDEFDDKLKALEIKAQAMKEKREAQKVQAAKEVKSTQMANDGLGMGMTLMYTVLGLPLLGGIIGMFLDKATGGNAWIVIFGMGGMILGIGCAVFLLYRKNGK